MQEHPDSASFAPLKLLAAGVWQELEPRLLYRLSHFPATPPATMSWKGTIPRLEKLALQQAVLMATFPVLLLTLWSVLYTNHLFPYYSIAHANDC